MKDTKLNVSVIGCGNVGVAIASDLSICGHNVTLIKTSQTNESIFNKIKENGNRILLKEKGKYTTAVVRKLTHDIADIAFADVIFVTIQSTYHESLIKKMSKYLNSSQVVVVICSYMSSMYFKKYDANGLPIIVETTGPYLEGRIEKNDVEGEIVFRVGCRLTKSPLSVFPKEREHECMGIIHNLYKGFSNDYEIVESALLNPNLVLHTIGSVMSIPRIEYSNGDFCMYREAYARGNNGTMQVMLGLDDEKKNVLQKLGLAPVDVFKAGGFLGDPLESFYSYAESSDRAISPTSIKSRYITEDVSQGLVLLESIANKIGVNVPITTSIINIASVALGYDFREYGRTIKRLNAEQYF